MREENLQEVLSVNRKVKDTFFRTVYASGEYLRELAAFLLGVTVDHIRVANVKPVIFGNKENDLSFLCSDAIYCMMEEQSSKCLNMPYRLLEYITAGLRSTVDSEKSLYSSGRVYFPIPKLYMVQVGLEEKKKRLSRRVQYDIRLSESFYAYADLTGKVIEPDLEVVVHVYDFRMTLQEAYKYIENEKLPARMEAYANVNLLNYALVANGMTYIQRIGKNKNYIVPANAANAVELLELLKNRGIFVELLSDQEVCNMTAATFSRDDILRYQGEERGIEKGIEAFIIDKLEDGIAEDIIIDRLQKRFELDADTAKNILAYTKMDLTL